MLKPFSPDCNKQLLLLISTSPQPMQIRPIAVKDGLGGAVGDDLAFFEPDHPGAEFLDDADDV